MDRITNLDLITGLSKARQLRDFQDFEEFNFLIKKIYNQEDDTEILECLLLCVSDKVGDLTYDWVMLDLIANIEAFVSKGEAFGKTLLETSKDMVPHAREYLSTFLLSLLYSDNHFEFLKQCINNYTFTNEVLEIVIPIFNQHGQEGNLRAQDVVRILASK